MKRSDLLKKLNRALSPNKVDYSALDTEINALKKKLEETVNIQTVDDVSRKLKSFQDKINLEPVIQEIRAIGERFTEKVKELQGQIDEKTKELETANKLTAKNETDGVNRTKTLKNELEELKTELMQLREVHEDDIRQLNESAVSLKQLGDALGLNLTQLINDTGSKVDRNKKESDKALKEVGEKIDTLRREILTRIANIGGGAMNRQILIGGVDYLKSYTDINFIAGTNITLTATNDDTNKRVNLTIIAAGGAGIDFEEPVGTVNDSNVTFTVTNDPVYIIVNGAQYFVGTGLYQSYSAPTITLTSPVGTGGFIRSAYNP